MKSRLWSLLLGFTAPLASAQITNSSFAPPVTLPAGDSPIQCALADLEGDGKPDLVVANYLNSTIGFYHNRSVAGTISAGSFAPPVHLPTGSGPHAMVLGDVDGDGRLDAVTSNLGNNTLSIFRNTSASNTIAFAAAVNLAIPGQLVRDAAIGDLDGDGRNDIAVVCLDSDNLLLLRNVGGPGNINFDAPFNMPNIGDGPHSVDIADIDGDGRRDIVVGNFQTPDLAVLRRAAAFNPARPFEPGDFAPAVRFPRGGNALELGDLDGDGRVDIAVGHWRTHGMALYRNISSTGTIALEAPVEFDVGNSIHNLAIRDLDADSKPELVMVGELPSFMSIYRNLSTPGTLTHSSFAPRVEFPSGWNAIGVAVADIDADARPDIAFANAYDDNIYVYKNRIGLPAPPVFVTQPQSQTVAVGGTAVFHVEVTGTQPFGYRWRHNGLTIVPFSEGTPTLVISNVQSSHAGSYDVIVTNAANLIPGVISARATLTVINDTNVPPTITRHPESQTVNAGADVTFTVEATGTEPLSYRWRRNGLILPGATNSVLTLSSVTISNAGFYSAIVSNIAGSRLSSNAQLRVITPTNPPPGTRLVHVASHWRYEQTGSDPGLNWPSPNYDDSAWPIGPGVLGVETAPLPEPIRTPLSLGPVTYYFRHSLNLQPEHVNLPTVFRARLIVDDGAVLYVNGAEAFRLGMPSGPITPNTLASRTVPDAIVEGPFTLPRELFVAGANTIAVEVHQSAFASSDIVFGMTLDVEPDGGDPVAPSITRQPASQTVPLGGTAVFSVEATGTAPLSYQWHKDMSAISGATDRVLTISNVSSNDVGFYSVLVSNTAGSIMSTQAMLRISAFPPGLPPMITSFTPQSGPIGTVVTISGMNFSPNALANRVYFGAMRARVVSGTSNVLTAEVPVGATFEPISVITSNRVAYSDRPFIVTFPSSRTIHPGSFTGFNLPAGDLPVHVAMGDMDRDGRLDFVAANHYSGTVTVYLNRSTNGVLDFSSFGPPRTYPTGPLPFHLALADMDGDGGLDVITANMGDHTISLLRNTPAGVFVLGPPLHFPVGQLPDALATGDLDKDGRTDIVVANQNADSITILRQISNPFSPLAVVPFTRTDLVVGDGPHNLIVGDVDGDGRPDITVANYLTPTMAILRNVTTAPGIDSGSFAPPVMFPRGGTCLGFGDLDGDGKQDLAVGNWRTQTLSIFRNLATPGVINAGSLAAPLDLPMGNNPHTIAFSDLDGDARLDIALVGELNSYMSIFKNLSSPGTLDGSSFGPRIDFASGWNAIGIAAGDLDGDSRPDLVFANAYDDNLTVYRNLTILEPNDPPVAHATASPAVDFLSNGSTYVILAQNGQARVVLDGTGSIDPDGDALSYEWSRDGFIFSTNATQVMFATLGTYHLTLTVSDGFAANSTTIIVDVIESSAAVEALIALVDESTLPRRSKRPIIAALKTAAAALADDRQSAIHHLEAARAKIERQIAPDNPDLAALLNAALQDIIDAFLAPQ